MSDMTFELEPMIDVGFTGTQEGMTEPQRNELSSILLVLAPGRFHHGVCIGADAQADTIAYALGYLMHLHPPIKRDKMAKLSRSISEDVIYEAKDYLDRNTDIAEMSNILIATPKEFEEVQRSGTWATVRRARKSKRCSAIYIIYPDGTCVMDLKI